MRTEYVIDGKNFATLEEFYDEVSRVMIPSAAWGRNLDAFDDILSGGFGTPQGGFSIRWKNAAVSRKTLGYGETVRQLELRLERCHPSNRSSVRADILRAKLSEGPTVFDRLIEIISDHGSDGQQARDQVDLILED